MLQNVLRKIIDRAEMYLNQGGINTLQKFTTVKSLLNSYIVHWNYQFILLVLLVLLIQFDDLFVVNFVSLVNFVEFFSPIENKLISSESASAFLEMVNIWKIIVRHET